MRYVITGSTGHISKPLAEKLLAAGHDVTIISSNPDKKADIERLGAKAAIGSVEDSAFLSEAFKGADAVYTMIPPTLSPSDWKKHIATVGKNYAEAIKKAGVQFVVNLSSVGAHRAEGVGPVSGLYHAEQALNGLTGVNVLHLRPGFFYYNFYANVGMIKHMGFIGGNYGAGTKIYLAHTNDIASVAADALLNHNFKGTSFKYIISDAKTTDEIATALGKAINKDDLKWVDFSDEQNRAGMVQAGLPQEIARNYTEMGAAMRSGIMFEDYNNGNSEFLGKIRLQDFAKEFAIAYNG